VERSGINLFKLKQIMVVAKPAFMKPKLAGQNFVKKFYTEFHENAPNSLVSYAGGPL
jgi:hypothetical protein